MKKNYKTNCYMVIGISLALSGMHMVAIEIKSIGQEVSLDDTSRARFSPDNRFRSGEKVIVYDISGAPRYAEIGLEEQASGQGYEYQVYMQRNGANLTEFVNTSQIGKI
jgi:hypothetical protein